MARLARRAHLPPHRAVQQDAVSLPAPGQPGAAPAPHLHQQAQAPRLAVGGEDEVGPGEVGVGGGVLGVGAAHQEGLPGAGGGGQRGASRCTRHSAGATDCRPATVASSTRVAMPDCRALRTRSGLAVQGGGPGGAEAGGGPLLR